MKKHTRSILDEITEMSSKNNALVIESRASHIITSAINLIELIRETYDHETAIELERRLINSIKGKDISKFTRGIKKIGTDTESSQRYFEEEIISVKESS